MRIALTIFTLLTLVTGTAVCQEQEGVKDEGAHQAEYNADAQDRDHSGEIDSRVQPSEDREGAPADPGEQDNLGATKETVNIVPTGSRTTSSAGSPGILMEDGEKTDGTNTKQWAEPNIAGSPVPGEGSKKTSGFGKTEVPENKVFSGERQKDVPATIADESNTVTTGEGQPENQNKQEASED